MDEHPERAPDGIEDPPLLMRKLEADTVFLTSRLPHFLHLMASAEERETRASKWALHSLQTYS